MHVKWKEIGMGSGVLRSEEDINVCVYIPSLNQHQLVEPISSVLETKCTVVVILKLTRSSVNFRVRFVVPVI